MLFRSDGENAVLFAADQPGAFEQALSRLCADPTLRAQVAAGARASIALQGLTWRTNAQRVVALAQSLAPGQGLPAALAPEPEQIG